MGLPGAGMEAFTHELTGLIKHHRTHQRIGAGVAFRQGRQLQRPAHPGDPALLSRRHGLKQTVNPSSPSNKGELV
jgi:hypothetical protein